MQLVCKWDWNEPEGKKRKEGERRKEEEVRGVCVEEVGLIKYAQDGERRRRVRGETYCSWELFSIALSLNSRRSILSSYRHWVELTKKEGRVMKMNESNERPNFTMFWFKFYLANTHFLRSKTILSLFIWVQILSLFQLSLLSSNSLSSFFQPQKVIITRILPSAIKIRFSSILIFLSFSTKWGNGWREREKVREGWKEERYQEQNWFTFYQMICEVDEEEEEEEGSREMKMMGKKSGRIKVTWGSEEEEKSIRNYNRER